jgi:hypothetical protein
VAGEAIVVDRIRARPFGNMSSPGGRSTLADFSDIESAIVSSSQSIVED